MAIDQRLDIRQSQQMVMTPQLQQSIKILQLASTDLFSYVAQELDKNPLLEGGHKQELEEVPGKDKKSEDIHTIDDQQYPKESKSIIDDSPGDGWKDDDISPAVYESNEPATYSGTGGRSDFSDYSNIFEETSAPKETLKEHVIDQINVDITDPVEKMIAVSLTDTLNENGYISINIEEVSKTLKCNVATIEKVLKTLQAFDPSGIFARDLSECLALQLKDKNRFDPAMEKLLENLDLLAKRDFKALQKACDVSLEDLREMCDEIKALNPKPGLDYSDENVQIIQPDVYLQKDPSGGWSLELNSEALPKVLINKKYYSKIKKEIGSDKESKKFLSDQLTSANWLIKALHQRANTILKITTEIVSQQDQFFRKGIQYLTPLKLSDIAQSIDMHESTVSRVINGKYLATHMGLFELKYFFSSSVQSADGDEDISSKTVKHRIKQLIENEDSKKTLSDDKISSLLKSEGIDCARRTVMKYREAMKIPSSFQRKRMKNSI